MNGISMTEPRLEKTQPEEWLRIESLDIEAQGVAHNHAGKVVFVEGALPGEEAQVEMRRSKNQWEAARACAIRRESALRVKPRCPHFGVCGGCAMQHLHPSGQIAIKQRVLEDNLKHLAKVSPDMVLSPIEGPSWGYRWRARLSVRHVYKKQMVLVGFREKRSSYVADMQSCMILPRQVSEMLLPLRALVMSLDGCDRIPQIELAVGEQVIALVLRHLEPLTPDDLGRLRQFAQTARQKNGEIIEWWLQPGGPQTVHLLDDIQGSTLSYSLPEFSIVMPYKPTDFTQVNPDINRVLVARAVHSLQTQPGERVIDWFCGLGNFTLPISRQVREVLGIEGSETLVARARENALHNGCNNAQFAARNLFELGADDLRAYGMADKWLIDPPREGALALVKALAELRQQVNAEVNASNAFAVPRRIVYVSCNPATLARDAGILVHQAGYRCSAAGVVNMFPHTAHVESIAIFDCVPLNQETL